MSSLVVELLNKERKNLNFIVTKDEDIIFVLIGTENAEKELVVELKGEGARAQILGLFILQEGEIKVRTIQHHLAPNTTSDLLFKTILLGPAQFDYQGLIKIDKVAQGANAYQRNDNLLLHEQAKVNTKPELEILANEVRCTHGATVGRLEENQIYYLTARGLNREQAVRLLLEGFVEQVIGRIPQGKDAEMVKELILSKMV